jgi:spore maturation protein CgeB
MESVYSKRIRAGKRRTYFFDVRTTRGNDYYLTITESRKRFNDDGYDRHKIFLYKEDFNKFLKALTEAVDHVKTELMPDFDFDAFNHDNDGDMDGYAENGAENVIENSSVMPVSESPAPAHIEEVKVAASPAAEVTQENNSATEEVDKW